MTTRGRWIKLLAWSAAVGAIWLFVLPLLATAPPVAERLEWLDEKGVDPSAMYYTELEMMKPIFDNLALKARD